MQARRERSDGPAAELEATLGEFLQRHQAVSQRLAVALSGGMDSMVLLEAMVRLRDRLGLHVQAIHVHHGLSEQADQWASHCKAECDARAIALTIRRIKVTRAGGESLEARARALRYECYAGMTADFILLAHHLDDQCETFFLRLLRGAGIEGLGGMVACRPLSAEGGAQVLRPFLEFTREQLMGYALQHALHWIEDDSNVDLRFARNHLRAEVLPRIAQRFPGYRATVARAMRNLREAAALRKDELKAEVEGVAHPLALAPLRALPTPQVLARLRAFLHRRGVRPPSRSHLEEIWRQMRDGAEDAAVRIEVDGGTLRRYRDEMYWLQSAPLPAADLDFAWHGQASVTLPGQMGELRFVRVKGEGIDERLLEASGWIITSATSSMRLRLARNRPVRTLKNLFQEAGIPPWQRLQTPALRRQDLIAWVAGLGHDVSLQPAADAQGILIEWISARPDALHVRRRGP